MRIARAVLILLGALLVPGCGYQTGYRTEPLSRGEIDSVSLSFTNVTFYRGIEDRLAKATIRQIEARTPYRVASRETADTVLECQVRDVSGTVLSRDPSTAIGREKQLFVLIDLTWKDQRTGKILLDRRELLTRTTYYPTLGEGDFVGSQEAAERLAVQIVDQLAYDW